MYIVPGALKCKCQFHVTKKCALFECSGRFTSKSVVDGNTPMLGKGILVLLLLGLSLPNTSVSMLYIHFCCLLLPLLLLFC